MTQNSYPLFIPVAWDKDGAESDYKSLVDVTGAELAKASAIGGEGYAGALQQTYREFIAKGGRPTDFVALILGISPDELLSDNP